MQSQFHVGDILMQVQILPLTLCKSGGNRYTPEQAREDETSSVLDYYSESQYWSCCVVQRAVTPCSRCECNSRFVCPFSTPISCGRMV